MKSTQTAPALLTLASLTQKGANLYFRLAGTPSDVQRDLYLLSNWGLTEIPLFYVEGDSDVICESNCYRVGKFVASRMEAKALLRGGWKAVRRLRKSTETKGRIANTARRLVKAYRSGPCMDSAADCVVSGYSMRAHGGSARNWTGENAKWEVSPHMASLETLAARLSAAHEHSAAR